MIPLGSNESSKKKRMESFQPQHKEQAIRLLEGKLDGRFQVREGWARAGCRCRGADWPWGCSGQCAIS